MHQGSIIDVAAFAAMVCRLSDIIKIAIVVVSSKAVETGFHKANGACSVAMTTSLSWVGVG
jgi:hypothetical protein